MSTPRGCKSTSTPSATVAPAFMRSCAPTAGTGPLTSAGYPRPGRRPGSAGAKVRVWFASGAARRGRGRGREPSVTG